MVNGIGTIYPCGLNKGFSSMFCEDSRVQHETAEEGQKTYRPKRCEYNNEHDDNILNILRDKILSHFISEFFTNKASDV